VLTPLGQHPATHHRLLMRELTALAQGETRRLMVLMPPGSAKSTYTSILFPAWWFTQHPRSSIIAASHTASLAEHFGRQIRLLIQEHGPRLGYTLRDDSRAARRFSTNQGGEYFSTGVRGPIVGRRADLILIDDPVKSQAEADSRRQRDQLHDWFRADLLSRLRPRGRVILIMTRWHRDDLAGRLLARPKSWRVLELPALARQADPLGRQPGDPLWPEWEDAAALEAKRLAVGERSWAALYQQSPRTQEGALFRIARLRLQDHAPPIERAVRAWDLAATSELGARDPDWTVGVKLARTSDGEFVILDIVRLRGDPATVEEAIRATARADGPGVAIGLPQDPGQAGRAQVLYLARRLAGHTVHTSPETGSKLTRATPLASQVNAGNLVVLRAPWTPILLEELQDFPHGEKDDQTDALSRAFAMLTDAPPPARRANVPLLAR
jgi:predicted phage terminase large subunit-like protein